MKILPVYHHYYRVFGDSLVDMLVNIVLSRYDCRLEVVVQVVQLLDQFGQFTITVYIFFILSKIFE